MHNTKFVCFCLSTMVLTCAGIPLEYEFDGTGYIGDAENGGTGACTARYGTPHVTVPGTQGPCTATSSLWRCGTTRKAVRVLRTAAYGGPLRSYRHSGLGPARHALPLRCQTLQNLQHISQPPPAGSSHRHGPHVEISQSILAFADNFASS